MSKTVLVVDDDKLVRTSLSSMLVSPDIAVETASNGKEGLKLALDKHPNLIITDVRMPEMDGLEMISQIRKDDWGKNVPIIIMTVDEGATTINKALEAGITVYISKTGANPQVIADQIVTALG